MAVWCITGVNIGRLARPTRSYTYTIDTNTSGQVKLDVSNGSPPSDPYTQWQLLYFGCTGCSKAAGGADPCGKGMSNTNQFLAGLDPTNMLPCSELFPSHPPAMTSS